MHSLRAIPSAFNFQSPIGWDAKLLRYWQMPQLAIAWLAGQAHGGITFYWDSDQRPSCGSPVIMLTPLLWRGQGSPKDRVGLTMVRFYIQRLFKVGMVGCNVLLSVRSAQFLTS
jgi:hypothetical protein